MSAASDSTNKKTLPFEPSNINLASLSSRRLALGLTIALAIVTVIAFVIYPILALDWRQQPFFGVQVSHTLVVDRGESLDGSAWPGHAAGLRTGDHILAIDDNALFTGDAMDFGAAHARFNDTLGTLNTGETITVTFSRPMTNGIIDTTGAVVCGEAVAGAAECTTSYTLSALSDSNLLGFFGIPYFTGLASLLIGLVVLYLRWGHPTARLMAATSFTAALIMGGLFDASTSQQVPHLWMFAMTMTGGLLAVLGLSFPTRISLGHRYPMIVYTPLLVSGLVLLIVFAQFANPPTPQTHANAERLAGLVLILGLILVLISMVQQRRAAVTTTVRNQANLVLSGVLLALAPALIWTVNIIVENATGSQLVTFSVETVTPFFILPPLSMAYAILQYQSLDTDRIISRGVTYVLMLSALIIGYSLLVLGVSLFAGELVSANNTIMIAITIFVSAVLFMPVRTYLQDMIDAVYFRTSKLYRNRVENFAGRLTSLTRLDEITDEFQRQLEGTLNPTNIFIFLPDHQSGDFVAIDTLEVTTEVSFEPETGIVSLLKSNTNNHQANDDSDHLIYLGPGAMWPPELRAERARLGILKSLVLAGLHGSNQEFVGFISIGPPFSGNRYTLEQLQYINGLTGQMALAIERANIIDRLERRVREMGVLSKVSEAVNFTIDFDVLLELIGEQATRLVEATHLYVVILDEKTRELYYAFFLENRERYPERENHRWPEGRDLYSDIITSGQPSNVANYVNLMRTKGYETIREDRNLRAWLGVPLVVQNRTLGVLAAGVTETGLTFSNDQLRIFGDLGSLAATSLDKALVYTQANTRARQLAALNEISQQLTSELDVDNLLQLIITSSANILNVDAASLLLTADDGSGDLEFRIAVGGSGQELIGSRIPAGRGLAGEVASSGQTVIVNNAAEDPRWSGEAADGDFHTQAVLAVPLVAQGNVVGVLEVINKKDGSLFIAEDVDVLSTFAGQAAVAIENARLFQMTDIQLSQRVAELEVLERIDVELNRSLDLDQVAEITMRWSVNNSNGAYGILGLVNDDSSAMQIISTYGYAMGDENGSQEDHRNKLLPLDSGIISRVMRTRQPDLVPDVSIDPNYEPILRQSISQITVPMFTGGEITAMLILETDKDPRLNLLDLAFVQRLAEHASIAIANAQLLDELTRANQSKSEFVSFVAHELKNPLTSIRGYTDVLLAGAAGDLSDSQENFLSTIRQNSVRMDTLISDLNDVTKMQIDQLPLEFSQISFRNVVTETLRPMQKQIDDKGQTLELSLPEDLPEISGDQNRLIQVMTNFVSNAYKYTPAGGRIIVGGELTIESGANGEEASQDMLHVWIKDDGIGMTEDDLSRLFTPYFRSENPLTREQPGTGLGLTLTRYLIERHGGRVWVESVFDHGTTFHFTLALVPDEAVEPVEPETAG